MADVRNTGTWQRVERGYNDMESLISRGEYNLALVKGRQTMEQIIRLCAARNFVVYTDLAETIDNLYRDGYISSESRDNCHTIRMLGNKAVHEGDNSSKDAGNAVRLLRREMSVFANESQQRDDRTPVMIKPARNSGRTAAPVRRREPEDRDRAIPDYRARDRRREQDSEINLDMISQNLTVKGQRRESDRTRRGGASRTSGGQSGRNQRGHSAQARRGSSGRNRRQGGVNIYDVLRILIPVICIILLVILIRGLIPSGNDNATTTAAPATTEAVTTEAVTETEPPTTEATTAAPVRYMINGNSVNVRFEPSTSARIYEQLSDGTEIGEVEEVEGGDWVKFTRDGIELYVGSDYITPIE